MNQIPKVHVLITLIGMEKVVNTISINVLMVLIGIVHLVNLQDPANKVIIKILMGIVLLSLKHVYHQLSGMERSVKLMEIVLLEHIVVEIVAKVMFLARMVMFGIQHI